LNEDNVLLIKMHNAYVNSLPKGKREQGETIIQTAVREVKEETGLDLTGVITARTECLSIHKTHFYVVECDELIKTFSNYNIHEI